MPFTNLPSSNKFLPGMLILYCIPSIVLTLHFFIYLFSTIFIDSVVAVGLALSVCPSGLLIEIGFALNLHFYFFEFPLSFVFLCDHHKDSH